MSIFENKFFSSAGQKERFSNVAQTLKSALTLRGVQANTKSRTANKIIETTLSNPYLTAGVIASGVTAAKYFGAKSSIGAKKTLLSAPKLVGSATGASKYLRTAGLIGGGMVAGTLLFRGGQSPRQAQDPIQEVGQRQQIQFDPNPQQFGADLRGDTSAFLRGRGNIAYQDRYNIQYQDTYSWLSPQQTATPTQYTEAGQQLNDGANSWIIPALIAGGIFLLSKR